MSEHEAHVAEVESRYPEFGAFLRRVTEDPESREAYYAAQSRRDEDEDADSPAESRWVVEPRDSATDAGLEGEAGGAPTEARMEAAPEPAGEVGRARSGLTDEDREALAQAIAEVIADHPMWQGVDYSMERERRITEFVCEASERCAAVVEARRP